jgi:hypothetical protein
MQNKIRLEAQLQHFARSQKVHGRHPNNMPVEQPGYDPSVDLSPPRPWVLAACVVATDEGLYLKEWLDWMFVVGIDHVFFYDDASIDDTFTILAPYIKHELVTQVNIHSLPMPWAYDIRPPQDSWQCRQKSSYHHCGTTPHRRNASLYKFFLNVDEFFASDQFDDIREWVAHRPALHSPCIMQYKYGMNNQTVPGGLVTERYTRRAGWSQPWKSATLSSCLVGGTSVTPWLHFQPHRRNCSEEWANCAPTAFLHHYYYKSLWDVLTRRPPNFTKLMDDLAEFQEVHDHRMHDLATPRIRALAQWPNATMNAVEVHQRLKVRFPREPPRRSRKF